MKALIKLMVAVILVGGLGYAAYLHFAPQPVIWKEGKLPLVQYPYCPVCDAELSLFSPGLEKCPKCGTALKWEKYEEYKKQFGEMWEKAKDGAAKAGEAVKEGVKTVGERVEEGTQAAKEAVAAELEQRK